MNQKLRIFVRVLSRKPRLEGVFAAPCQSGGSRSAKNRRRRKEKEMSYNKKPFSVEMFTENSLAKVASFDQMRFAANLFHSKEVDLNKVFKSASWLEIKDSDGKVIGGKCVFDGKYGSLTLGEIMDSQKATSKAGKEYNHYYVWDAMNVVDAYQVLEYLKAAPIKGSNNGTVQSDRVTAPQTLGFGGRAK